MSTRREFIQASLLSSASVALGACRAESGTADASDIRALSAKLRGRVVLPTDADYDSMRRVSWMNPANDKRPVMFVQVASDDDVARSIEFARRHGLQVAVRSGGHSNMGWGVGDGLVIDLKQLNSITVDPATNTLRCGTGAIAGDLVNAAAKHGLAPALGECASVGAGLALGGGVGWLAGKHGATCDNVLSARLMTASSHVLTASGGSNEDLYWAIRGGGGNFGVVTEFEYRLHPVREVLAGGMSYPQREARSVIRFYRDFMAEAPDELQGLAYLSGGDHATFLVLLVHSGDPKAGDELVRRFRQFRKPLKDWIERRPYADVYTMPPYSDDGNGPPPCAFHAIRGTYIERLSDDAIDLVLDRFAASPPACGYGFDFDHYMHGEVCRVAPDATAFNLRAPGAIHLAFGAEWNAPEREEACVSWLDETWRLLQRHSGGRMYTNFASVEDKPAAEAAYGSNYGRLASIKRRHDPDNVFRRNLNIEPA